MSRNRRLKLQVFRVIVFLLLGAFFLVPIGAMFEFSTRGNGLDAPRTLAAWQTIFQTPDLVAAILASLALAVLTSLGMLLLLVPTMIWVRLRLPHLSRVIEFLCLLPLTIPAIVLVAGLAPIYLWMNLNISDSILTLAFVYLILVLPYAYRALYTGLAAIDVKTLAEAARSLGANWGTVMLRVIVPNMSVAILNACLLSVAVVLGEFTIANLLNYVNLQVAIALLGRANATVTIAVAAAGVGTATRAGVEIRLENLRRRYGAVTALDGLTLTLAPGELVALLGPSGCGKTTALRLLAGLEEADGGRVVIGGHDVTGLPANKRDTGMVFQAYSLFPHMTAWENVAFGLQMRKIGAADRRRRAIETLELVGLGGFANRYTHQMSGGQQQRVALARALAIRPEVLLRDEPLTALDAKVRVRLRDEIRRVQLEVGITTLFVTHDQEDALAIADRVGVMQSV